MKLMAPFLNTNRNLTGDNWFTSSTLADRLLRANTTYVGTIRRNRRDVPPVARSVVNRQRGDTKVYVSGTQLLCSYWDKGTQPVLLLDTFAPRCEIPPVGEKSSTVMFYNKTKCAVDDMDKKVRMYSTKRKCCRWPYSFIMNLIDVASVNATIIRQKVVNVPEHQRKNLHRQTLSAAGYQMVNSLIDRRLAAGRLHRRVFMAMQLLGKIPPAQAHGELVVLPRKTRCLMCPRGQDRKTLHACSACRRAMCNDHRSSKCKECDL